MKSKNLLITLLLMLVCAALILFGGLFFSKRIDVHERRKIDANGGLTHAIIYKKTSNSKGRSVFYRFAYNNKIYKGSQAGTDLYEELENGDSITIKYQLTDPDNSYVFSIDTID